MTFKCLKGMDIGKILAESAKLMAESPKAFVPRIVTTAVYSVIEIAIAVLLADSLTSFGDPQAMNRVFFRALFLLAVMPFVYLGDLFTYAMYPAMVADLKRTGRISLMAAMGRAARICMTPTLVWILMRHMISKFASPEKTVVNRSLLIKPSIPTLVM